MGSMAEWVAAAGIFATIVGALAGFVKVVKDARSASETASVQATRDLIEGMRNELADLRTKVESLEARAETQRRQLNLVVSDRDDLAAYILRFTRWLQGGAAPPPPVVPAHLRTAFESAGVPWPGDPLPPQSPPGA